MTSTTPDPTVLRNASRRPVELHLRTGTVVLLPGETITAPLDDPYCAVLERRGLLTRHSAPAEPAKKTAARKKTTKRSATKKTATKKTAIKKSSRAGAATAAVKDEPHPTDTAAAATTAGDPP